MSNLGRIIAIIVFFGLFLFVSVFVFVHAQAPQADKIRLSWEAVTENVDGSKLTDLAGYEVRAMVMDRMENYRHRLIASTMQTSVVITAPVRYTIFYVLTKNTTGHYSRSSDTVSYYPPGDARPSPPKVRINFTSDFENPNLFDCDQPIYYRTHQCPAFRSHQYSEKLNYQKNRN